MQLFLGDALLPRFVVFGAVLLLFPWYLLCVAVSSGGRLRGEERDRILVVGDNGEAENLRLDLQVRPERPGQVVAAVSLDEVGTHLDRLVQDCRATVLVFTREALLDERVVHQAAMLHEGGIRVRTLASFSEQWLGKLPVSELERTSLMFDIRELHRALYGRVSRLLDIVLSAVGLLVLVPVVLIVVVGNLVANRGPLFYRQPRVGRNGRIFEILKFRTMRPEQGHLLNEWTTENDPRITSFGKILRVTHLDELPQVLNILKGDLSVVGPRPEQPYYVEELTTKIPFYNLRHLVRPGLTGWAQVKYGYAGSESDALEKLQYEFYYLRHQNLWFDLKIMGRTVRSVFGRRGR
ncbi:MAG: sugar transferase [Actinomycetota bacterium]|nr:sugar transferase [Actinomycetota bacterium]